jgi:rRNA-processing protein FCF1
MGISLTLGTDRNCDDAVIKGILEKYDCDERQTTSPYQKWAIKSAGVTVTRFEDKLLVQGKENEDSLELIKDLVKLDSLKLDRGNYEKFTKLFGFSHNAIVCTDCHSPSVLLIEGHVNDTGIVFKKDCGHNLDMKPPLIIYTCRILPDLNILVSGMLSRCINLGHFDGFEIVIPTFVLEVIDVLLGSKEKKGASNEINRLIELAKEGRIRIFNCKYENPMLNKDELEIKEDNFILKLSNLTNSILFTSDRNLRDKALLGNRPTIYIDPKYGKNIKILCTD